VPNFLARGRNSVLIIIPESHSSGAIPTKTPDVSSIAQSPANEKYIEIIFTTTVLQV
jgi:hypothetical protein